MKTCVIIVLKLTSWGRVWEGDSPWEGDLWRREMCKNPQMCKQPHLCKHFAHKCANNHICANISPTNVQTPILSKHFATVQISKKYINHKCANITPTNVQTFNFDVKCANNIPQNVQIIVFKNQFTSAKLSTDDKLVLSQHLYTQVRSLGQFSARGHKAGGHRCRFVFTIGGGMIGVLCEGAKRPSEGRVWEGGRDFFQN